MTKPDLAKIREREADPNTIKKAEARLEVFQQRVNVDRLNELAFMAQKATTPQAKIIMLRRVADSLAEPMKGVAPCTKGCNSCCHIPVALTQVEAEHIAKETGAKLSKPRKMSHKADRSMNGTRCTFLTRDGCSIYEFRPYTCRVHYSLDQDSLLCKIIPGEDIKAPYMNPHQYNILFLGTLFNEPPKVADIRSFFPNGLKR